MGKFSGVLIASDFDNTLIYTEGAMRRGEPIPPLPESNRKALEYFMAEGGCFIVSTGRALQAMQKFLDQVPCNSLGIVCNGAALYDYEQQAYLELLMLNEEALVRGQAMLDQFPDLAVEAYYIGNTIYAVHPNEVTQSHVRLTKVETDEKPLLTDVPLPVGKLLFEAEHETLEQVHDELKRRGWAEDYELIYTAPELLEMTVRGFVIYAVSFQQGKHGAPSGGASGNLHGARLLRGRSGQRSVHAGGGIHRFRSRQLQRRGSCLRSYHRGRCPGRCTGGCDPHSGRKIHMKQRHGTASFRGASIPLALFLRFG